MHKLALGVQAIKAGRSVYFTPLSDLVSSLAKAERRQPERNGPAADQARIGPTDPGTPARRAPGKWHVQPTFWLPTEGLAEKAVAERVPYDLWHARSSELQRWIRAERERLHEKALEGLTNLLAHLAKDGGIERGIRTATRLLLLDPLRESVQRTLMELYCKQGRHAAALHQYRVCAELLAKELGVEPEPATKALYREIREQRNRVRNEVRTAPSAEPGSNAVAEPDLPRSLERRQLTVLVCSLAGMSRLSAALDPEEASTLIGEHHRNCSEVISRYGGVMERFSADEILVCFGYPQADEFDAEEAVHAGLALVEAVTRPETGCAAPLQLRVGIATGSVICGDLVGHGNG